MEDIPQPADEPYEIADKVRVYFGPDDEDSLLHGLEGTVTHVREDDLDKETGRPLDAYEYQIDTSEMWLRHRDLVPRDE